jgi:hypothetical protein
VQRVVEVFQSRGDMLLKRVRRPLDFTVEEYFGRGCASGLRRYVYRLGYRRELSFYTSARIDGLVRHPLWLRVVCRRRCSGVVPSHARCDAGTSCTRADPVWHASSLTSVRCALQCTRVEDIGKKITEWYEPNADCKLLYRSVTLLSAEQLAEAGHKWNSDTAGGAGGKKVSTLPTLLTEAGGDQPILKMTEKYARNERVSAYEVCASGVGTYKWRGVRFVAWG